MVQRGGELGEIVLYFGRWRSWRSHGGRPNAKPQAASGFPMFDFGLQEHVVFIIRIIATVGSAVLGWFVSDPLMRLTYRVSFRAATPIAVLFTGKTVAVAPLACAVWFLTPRWRQRRVRLRARTRRCSRPVAGKGGNKSASAEDPRNTKDKTEANKSGKISNRSKKSKSSAAKPSRTTDRNATSSSNAPSRCRRRDQLDDYLKKNRTKIEVIPGVDQGKHRRRPRGQPLEPIARLTKKYDVKTLRIKTP